MTAQTAVGTATRRRGVPGRTRLDFFLDAGLFLAFTLDYSFQFTGIAIHEWIGLALAVALPVHITLHWDWVLRTAKRLLGRLAGREKVRWILDFALIAAMTLCIASGILISRSALPSLGLTATRDPFWTGLHTTTADFTVAFVALHIALSCRWIFTVGRRIIGRGAVA